VLRKASRHVVQEFGTASLTELEMFNERDVIFRTSSLNNSPKYKHNFEREPTWIAAIIRTHKSKTE
jgi:hypothetical protein